MQENVRKIIEAISAGASLKHALTCQDMTAGAFNHALSKDREAATAYIRAQEIRADLLADEIIDIADTEPDAQVARNRIDARKWIASKHHSKRYGDRIDVNVTQSIDISATLAEARGRVRSISDQSKTIEAQAIDITNVSASRPSDCESLAALRLFE